jgi:hypothetical protein
MKYVNLRVLPGFPPAYLKFVEGDSAPVSMTKETLLSRCKAASRQTLLCAAACEAIREEVPALISRDEWLENLRKLESCAAVVIGASAAAGDFTVSLAPLLKCLTAIKVAAEISREGLAAVPVLWLRDEKGLKTSPAEMKRSSTESGVGSPEKQGDGAGKTLTKNSREVTETPSKIDLHSKQVIEVLTHLVGGFGMVPVGEAAVGTRLSATREFGELRRQAAALLEQAPDEPPQSRAEASGSDDPGLKNGGAAAALIVRLCLPEAAEVVGPDDFAEMESIGRLLAAAGRSKPLLWPRVSATIVDRRSSRIMAKYGLELPDALQGSAALLGRFPVEQDAARVLELLEGLAGMIESRISDLSARAAGDARTVGKVRASGSRMLYQVRKLAERFRLSAGIRREIAGRQIGRVCSHIGPGGDLQERGFSAAEFISAYPEPGLARLYSEINVWEFRHQLIQLD